MLCKGDYKGQAQDEVNKIGLETGKYYREVMVIYLELDGYFRVYQMDKGKEDVLPREWPEYE